MDQVGLFIHGDLGLIQNQHFVSKLTLFWAQIFSNYFQISIFGKVIFEQNVNEFCIIIHQLCINIHVKTGNFLFHLEQVFWYWNM